MESGWCGELAGWDGWMDGTYVGWLIGLGLLPLQYRIGFALLCNDSLFFVIQKSVLLM